MSITAKVKYLKSVLRFLAVITVSTASILGYNMEDGSPISFQRSLRHSPLLPRLIDPFPPQEKTLCLESSHSFWNGRSIGKVVPLVHATKKLRKIKKDNEAGLIEGTFIMYHRFEQNDLQIPAVMTLEWYRNRAIEENAYEEYKKSFIKKMKMKGNNTGGFGKDWTLYQGEMGNIPLELSINGNITFNGNLRFEDKDLVTTNRRDQKNWDLEIEQTQRFNIMGNIGNRFFINISQDSEADFTWENDLNIEYRGQKNEIFQKVEAGNIKLNLVGMDAVNMGGNNSSLFGIKAMYQLGPVEMQSVIAMEQVKKSEKTMTGGMETGVPISKNDYNFVYDRYFFIDETFKNNFYPLDENHLHSYNPYYVIGNFEVYKKVEDIEGDPIPATAYLDPAKIYENPTTWLEAETDSVRGNWKRLNEYVDYEINRMLGYIRVNSSTAQNEIAIAYTITNLNLSTKIFGTDQDSTGTNFKQEYINCITTNEGDSVCEYVIKLKLIKATKHQSSPSSATWPLMFKNVYSLGGSNIGASTLEVEIALDESANLKVTHSDNGNSYLSIFGLDSEDQTKQKVPEGCDNITLLCMGDGKIDLYESIINFQYGELILPAHLPFAYDESADFGNNHNDLYGLIPELNEADGSPAMYFDTNTDNRLDEHEFVINVKTSTQSSSMDLDGFMIVEGSETVRLGSQVLQKDVDYTIDYFTGKINFISEDALNPGAEISVSFEENELISFDLKLLAGTYAKYEFGEKNYLAGGMFYYNQSIAEEKVDIGYEPMRNFAWNISGKYQNEWGLLTRAVDFLPLIQTTKPSQFSINGNYAQIIPNPNPLGQAFIDDFESAKRTTSFSIMQRQWKMASPPDSTSQDSSQTLQTRGRMIWYNPYEDEPTKNIWPEQSTSTQANNNTTKILHVETEFQGDDTLWNGIMIPLYAREQNESKYLDIWLNAGSVSNSLFKLYIDIGHISEDWNNNGKLDTEDEPVYGPGMGDNFLSDGEDIGVDNCTNSYENGWGGCLCKLYDDDRYESNLNGINIHTNPAMTDRNGKVLKEFCIDTGAVRYIDACVIAEDYPDSVSVNLNTNVSDPNGDNWSYTEGSNDYSFFNGTEGNGQAMGYRYPDTEDMDKNKTLDTKNRYFTVSFEPKDTIMLVTETVNSDGGKTGWKLFRIPLINFDKVGEPEWNDVRSFRLRIETAAVDNSQLLKIAKIEMVANEWKELGIAHKDNLDSVVDEHYFTVEVINTDESTAYKNSLDELDDIIQEHDEYNDIDMKEQSLVLSFLKDPDKVSSGLAADYAGLIKNSFPALSSDKSLSYFAYDFLKMYVYGGDPESDDCDWCDTDSSEVDLLFRFGRDDDDNYYEIRQPIYDGWNDKNHLNINIDQLTQMKIPIMPDNSPAEILYDVGLDGFASDIESGCIGDDEYPLGYAASYTYDDILAAIEISSDSSFYLLPYHQEGEFTLPICGQLWWEEKGCTTCSINDPNGDNYSIDNNPNGTEGNESFDYSDINEDGLYTTGEAEPAEEDYNGDGIYTPHPSYDYENNLYVWDDPNGIKKACHNCTALHIKGEPSINNIQNIVIGVVNNTSGPIYGKVLINELRMKGVKKSKEESYSIGGSINFADLMTISGNYNHKESGFHKLQQRLGTGNSDDTYNTTIKLYPNIILPVRWGIKTPVTVNYINSIQTPKYYPGSDILTKNKSNIENIQKRNEQITLSTLFSKSARSPHWLMKRTIDNISLKYSAIMNNLSDSQIQEQTKQDYQISGSYTYNWGKENYFSPFKFTKDWLILGNILSQSRYYYTPDKFSTSIQFNESDKRTIQRVSNAVTKTYNFNMLREFKLNHKFTKTLSSNYSWKSNSNLDLDRFKDDKWKIIIDMDPGLEESMTQKFTNTYKPDFLKWLNPNVTFNPTYNWKLDRSSEIHTAEVTSKAIFKTQLGLSIQDFIELIYTPENKGKSSRSRGRSRSSSSSNKNDKKINIQNPLARFILGKIHSLSSKIRKISPKYTYEVFHAYDNIRADLSPSYLYRFGLQESPLYGSGKLNDPSLDNSSIVPSEEHKYKTDISTETTVNFIQSVSTSLKFKYANSLSKSSISSTTEHTSFSYYPLGNRGDEGFRIANWSINWSKIEKWWILDKLFKSVSLSHGFNGEQSMSYNNSILQNEDYSFSYSPIIGINSITKGRNPITLNANYYLNQTIKNIDESTERNHNHQMSMTIKVKKSGGLKIKTFFFEDFYIRNAMDFSLTFNYNTDRTLKTSSRVSNISDFNEHSKSLSWSFKPEMRYTFTDYISGNFYIIYGIIENQTTGRKEEKDFGFTMNIKIHG